MSQHVQPAAPTALTAPSGRLSAARGPHVTAHRLARQPRIAVVGGSLTGPTLALLLTQAGFDHVTVYEAAPTLTALGGVMSIEHTALDILERAGLPRQQLVTGPSETIEQITVRDRHRVKSSRISYPGQFTTWTLLHTALRARLPEGILRSGFRVVDLRQVAGRPVVVCADGRAEPADLVVFADGRNSTGRRLLDPGRTRCYSGCVAHRGTLAEPGDAPGDFQRFDLGRGAQFNLARVPEGQDWIFGLNATRAEYTAWFGAPPEARGYVTRRHVGAAARAHVDREASRRLPPAQADLVLATTQRAAVAVIDIDPPTQMVWPIGTGYAALLGDALAPPRPLTARGANTGIEQAADLVTCLTQHCLTPHDGSGADLGAALRGWERRHLPEVLATLTRGLVLGDRLGLGTSGNDRRSLLLTPGVTRERPSSPVPVRVSRAPR